MYKTTLLITLCCLPVILLAQASGNYQYNQQNQQQQYRSDAVPQAQFSSNREVIVRVNGLANVKADAYVAMFNLVQVGETAETTDQLMNSRIQLFRDELRKAGIDSSRIVIDMISFVPRYDVATESKVFSKNYNEVPAGFEMQKNVMVHFKSNSEIDRIVSAAAKSEIYDLVKVDYFVSDPVKIQDELRDLCTKEIKKQLKSYESLGIKLDTLKKVVAEESSVVSPPSRYFGYQAFSRPSLQAAKKKSNVNEIGKATSRYYQPLENSSFDIVINPVITEPVVQYTLSIAVKYFREDEPIKTQHYIITNTGDVKLLNVK